MTGKEIRVNQRALISKFIASGGYNGKRVLDFGCGLQPHREIIEAAGGDWTGYNRSVFPGANAPDEGPDDPLTEKWDIIVCAQMLQYVPDVPQLLADFRAALNPDGILVLTYATNWPEVENTDLWRFTKSGMEHLLGQVGFKVLKHKQLGSVPFGDHENQAHGYGVTALGV